MASGLRSCESADEAFAFAFDPADLRWPTFGEGFMAGLFLLAHLGGLIGGILADLKCPIEAVRVLHEKGVINPKETEKLLRRTSKGEYENDSIATMEEMKKAEGEKAETDSRKEAAENA